MATEVSKAIIIYQTPYNLCVNNFRYIINTVAQI